MGWGALSIGLSSTLLMDVPIDNDAPPPCGGRVAGGSWVVGSFSKRGSGPPHHPAWCWSQCSKNKSPPLTLMSRGGAWPSLPLCTASFFSWLEAAFIVFWDVHSDCDADSEDFDGFDGSDFDSEDSFSDSDHSDFL